jgi:hypothetical protein
MIMTLIPTTSTLCLAMMAGSFFTPLVFHTFGVRTRRGQTTWKLMINDKVDYAKFPLGQ